MFRLSLVMVLFWATAAAAGVLNVEFKFTPYTGDPEKSDRVETVPGIARVYINNVPFAEQEVAGQEAQVLFAERDISPSVWVPASSLGGALRRGNNRLRIEFVPKDGGKPYQARLSWAQVTDETTEKSGGGRYSATNESGTGRETRDARGKVVLEHEFAADFAADQPWHHYPPVTALSQEDKNSLALLVEKRAAAFRPNFAPIYELLGNVRGLDPAEMKKAKCLEQAHGAGLRVAAPPRSQLELATTGNQEVVVSRAGGAPLYRLDGKALDRIKGDEARVCASVALSVAFPPRLIVVRSPTGTWEVVY